MATNPMRLSADDVLEIPIPDHLRGYELVDGELVEVSLVSPPHGRIAVQMGHRLLSHIEQHGIGGQVYAEAGYVLRLPRDPERLRGPDVSYVSQATLDAHGSEPEKGWFRLVPDLVVEIDSPGRRPGIEQRRIRDYLDAGVRVIWVIHTATQSATVHTSDGAWRSVNTREALEGGMVLPGLILPLSQLFRA
jgi:Uma2 family endonuclease